MIWSSFRCTIQSFHSSACARHNNNSSNYCPSQTYYVPGSVPGILHTLFCLIFNSPAWYHYLHFSWGHWGLEAFKSLQVIKQAVSSQVWRGSNYMTKWVCLKASSTDMFFDKCVSIHMPMVGSIHSSEVRKKTLNSSFPLWKFIFQPLICDIYLLLEVLLESF